MNLFAAFSNVAQPRKVIYSTATGVSPQAWTMWAIPQDFGVIPYGSLSMSDGTFTLVLSNCKLIKQELSWGVYGPVLKLTGLDRRAYWQGKAIDGQYNIRGVDGNIIAATERTPQQLALLLWTAMGEPFANVAALPNSDRPEINWECADAASELERLCDRYGCSPTLDIATDTAGIVIDGIGNFPPNTLDIRYVQIGTTGVLPNRVEACSGYALLQSKLKLEPILEDTDGTYKAADEVAYAPSGGWAGEVSDLESPLQPDNSAYSEANAERAKMLWRLWRVTGFADGGLTHPVLGPVNYAEELLPISNRLLTAVNTNDGEIKGQAYLVGTTSRDTDPPSPSSTTDDGSTVNVPFTVDPESGIVATSIPLSQLNSSLELSPADLWIVCAHMMRDTTTNQFVRYVRFNAPGGLGGVETARRPDVIPRIVLNYGTGSSHTTVTGSSDNLAFVTLTLDDELATLLQILTPRSSAVYEYNGIQPISADGTIRSVTFQLDSETRSDDRNCVTIVSYNTEGGPILYQHERRRQQATRALSDSLYSNRVSNRRLVRGGFPL